MDAYRWALTWDGLTSPEKFVLVMIGDHYNEKSHRAWPSIERLAKSTALHRATVIRAIKSLEDKGLVEVEPWVKADKGGALNNRYCLPFFDPLSQRAKRLPVVAFVTFNPDGDIEYDTLPHHFRHDEEVPSHVP